MKDTFINRKYVIIALIVLASAALIIRLFIIQVVKDTYRLSADNNVLRYVTQYPARGLIYDRNGKLVVFNQAAYDLMVIPAQTGKMDTALFCNESGNYKGHFQGENESSQKLFPQSTFNISETDFC